MKTEEAIGWGLRVGGPLPYVGYSFSVSKEEIEKQICAPYHSVIKVAIIPVRELRRLQKLDKKKKCPSSR